MNNAPTYHVDPAFNGRIVLYPIRGPDGGFSMGECEVFVFERDGVGWADIHFEEKHGGGGENRFHRLSEEEMKMLKPDGDRLVYCE